MKIQLELSLESDIAKKVIRYAELLERAEKRASGARQYYPHARVIMHKIDSVLLEEKPITVYDLEQFRRELRLIDNCENFSISSCTDSKECGWCERWIPKSGSPTDHEILGMMLQDYEHRGNKICSQDKSATKKHEELIIA